MAKLFISHASSDLPLVKALVELLESGAGVSRESIFCSSLEGQNIKPGTYFIPTIKKELEGSECVLVLVTENYFASHFCLCELGAGWSLSKRLLPFAAPKLDQSLVKALLEGMIVGSIQNSQDLDELRDTLIAELGIKGYPTPRWNERREQFLGGLAGVLNSIVARGPVAREAHEKVLHQLGEYQVDYANNVKEILRLNTLIEHLKATKDRTQVARVFSEHSDAVTRFRALASQANKALGELGHVLHEAIYYETIGEEFSPERDDFEDARRMIEEGQLRDSSVSENAYVPDISNPLVRNAVDAVSALRKWLEAVPSPEFYEWYEEANGQAPDISKRPFWRKHLW